MIVVTAFGSIFALLLGYSRVPYAAARDGVFFQQLAQLHPTKEFPHRLPAADRGRARSRPSFFSLDNVIKALMAARILIQFIGHTIALFLIRRRAGVEDRPFSMWGYPLPAIISLVGYIYVVPVARHGIRAVRSRDAAAGRRRVPCDRAAGRASGRSQPKPGSRPRNTAMTARILLALTMTAAPQLAADRSRHSDRSPSDEMRHQGGWHRRQVRCRRAQGQVRVRDERRMPDTRPKAAGMLAARRRAEARESGRRLGIEYITLENHDGELVPSLDVRLQVIRQIRGWDADIVIAPRPNDYHPDHRTPGISSRTRPTLVTVPNIASDTPAIRKNPLFLYFSDDFTRPQPFRPDIVVSIDDVIEKKYAALDAHVSQFYEWLPWHAGILDQVPKDPAGRLAWLKSNPELCDPRRVAGGSEEALRRRSGQHPGGRGLRDHGVREAAGRRGYPPTGAVLPE